MKWTMEEVCLVRTGLPAKELSEILGRSIGAIYTKRCALKNSDYEGIFAPEPMSKQEKEARIYKLATQMRVKIQ